MHACSISLTLTSSNSRQQKHNNHHDDDLVHSDYALAVVVQTDVVVDAAEDNGNVAVLTFGHNDEALENESVVMAVLF